MNKQTDRRPWEMDEEPERREPPPGEALGYAITAWIALFVLYFAWRMVGFYGR